MDKKAESPTPPGIGEANIQQVLYENQRQKALLEALFEADPSGIAVLTGPDLNFVYINPAYRYVTPDPRIDPVGKSYEQVWPEKSKYANRDRIREVLRTGTPFQQPDIELCFPDRANRYFNIQARRIEWGDEAAVLVILWDVTQLKNTEHSLRRKEERLRVAADAAQVGVFDRDIIRDEFDWDQRIRNIWGVEEDTPINYETFINGVHPADRVILTEGLEKAFDPKGDGKYSTEYRVINRKDRTERWVRANGQVIFEEGQAVRLIGTVEDINERKHTELILQEYQKKYRDQIRNTQAAIYEIDFRTQRFVSVNDGTCQLSGYTREELMAMSPFDLLDNESKRLFQERIQRWMAGERPEEIVEYKVIGKGGREIYALLNVTFNSTPDGKPCGATVIGQDVTERKHMELTLRQALHAAQESENRFRLVLENSLDVAYRRDLIADRYDYMSPVVSDVFGFTPEEMNGMPIDEVIERIHPDDWEHVNQQLELANQIGTAKITYRFKTKPGIYRWIADHVTITKDEKGTPIYRTGILRDIHESKITEEKLKRSQRVLGQAEQMAHLGAWEIPILDRQNINANPLYWSDEVYRIFGYEPGEVEVSNQLFFSHIPPEEQERINHAVQEAAQARQPYSIEHRIIDKNGVEKIVFEHSEMLFDEQGRLERIIGAVQDISTQKRVQEDLLKDQAHIEVQRRLLEQREQERLQIARDLHDGPTQELLGAIYAVHGLMHKNEDPALQADLEYLQEMLQEQVNNLRAFASQLRPPTLDKFGLVRAIRSYAEDYGEKHPDLKIVTRLVRQADLVPAEMRLAIFRIYQEALNNIAKHARATSVHVRMIKKENTLVFEIRDNGTGYTPPADWLQLARQGHLGLVGMRERAEAIGGSFSIGSHPGGGTIIQVKIGI